MDHTAACSFAVALKLEHQMETTSGESVRASRIGIVNQRAMLHWVSSSEEWSQLGERAIGSSRQI